MLGCRANSALALVEHLPSGAYFDLDEMRGLLNYRRKYSRKGAPFFFSSASDAIDVERPAELSRQHIVALNIPVFARSPKEDDNGRKGVGGRSNEVSFRSEVLAGAHGGKRNEWFANILTSTSVPLHLRYQMPDAGDEDGFSATILPPPQVYARCNGAAIGHEGDEGRPWIPVEINWGSEPDHQSRSADTRGDLRARVCRSLARQKESLLSWGYICLSVPVGRAWHWPGVAISTLVVSIVAAVSLIVITRRVSTRGEGSTGWSGKARDLKVERDEAAFGGRGGPETLGWTDDGNVKLRRRNK